MKKAYLKMVPYLVLAALVGLVMLVVEAFSSIQMMHVVDSALGTNNMPFEKTVVGLVLLTLLMLPLQLMTIVAKAFYKKKAVAHLKSYYMGGLFKMDIQAFHGENSFNHVSAITNDMANIESNFIEGVYEVVFQTLAFISGIVMIAYVSPWILLVGVVVALLSMALTQLVGKPLQKHHEKRSSLFSNYTSYIKECLGAFHIIKVNNLTEKVKDDFAMKSKDIQDRGYLIDKISTYVHAFQNTIMSFTFVAVVGVSVWMTMTGLMTFGGIILVINSMERIMGPIMQMAEWFPKLFAAKALFPKLDQNLFVNVDTDEHIQVNGFEDAIALENIMFSYGETNVLHQANAVFKKGKKYLVVGPSGGGKSTLLKLLRKYFVPQAGTMRIDGIPLENVTKESYFQLIANVEQSVFLFEDSLMNNLCLYKNYASDEVHSAIVKAGLLDFAYSHPEGLNRKILDNGKNISGGERSRIAIARGLIQKAQIIFLDEAFSSLDEKVAMAIEDTLLSLEGITVINVSHVVFDDTKNKYDDVVTIGKNHIVFA